MRPGSLILILISLLMSCGSRDHIPRGVLPPDKMQAVLWDLSRSDQWLNGYVFPDSSTLDQKMESIKMYEQIFSLHHTNKEEFQKSFKYYQAHVSAFKPILDSISAKSNNASIDLPIPGKPTDTSILKRFPQRNLAETLKFQRPIRIRPQ
ncbi:MAG TPA: DUF4296 domain-containing protein [Chitinophagaceae bacterium]|nr:DUF4296 domain-containing protein [Chitinophagaceae bacterium]